MGFCEISRNLSGAICPLVMPVGAAHESQVILVKYTLLPYGDSMKQDATRIEREETVMTPSHPGAFIRSEVIDELGLTIAKAAEVLGVRAASLSDLLNEKCSLSPEMAMRIDLAFNVKVDLLLRIQALHDSAIIRRRAAELNVRRYEPQGEAPR